MMFVLILFLAVAGIFLYKGMEIIPQQEAWAVERLGKFSKILKPGPNWIVPFIDHVAYRHSLKEEAMHVPEQTAITQDNVSLVFDGFVYVKIVDPFAASYGVKDPFQALIQLVQTSMRSEIGKIPLDKTFEERESLNAKIVEAINLASFSWGIRCLRYEIKDIRMPEEIRKAMELQMTAERQKRARILESEGFRQSEINQSEGQKQAQINIAEATKQKILLESEAAQIDQINRARGEAEAIELLAEAHARGMGKISQALLKEGGEKAAELQVAEKYLDAFKEIAKEGNTIVLPSNLQSPGLMVAEALTIFDQIKKKPLSKLSLPLETRS